MDRLTKEKNDVPSKTALIKSRPPKSPFHLVS